MTPWPGELLAAFALLQSGLSGIGFGLGVDRTVQALEAEGATIEGVEDRLVVFGVAIGEEARRRMAVLVDELRSNGIRTDMAYGGRGLKGAMKGADRSGAHTALVLGERELEGNEITLKNLNDQAQRTVALDVHEIIDAIYIGPDLQDSSLSSGSKNPG